MTIRLNATVCNSRRAAARDWAPRRAPPRDRSVIVVVMPMMMPVMMPRVVMVMMVVMMMVLELSDNHRLFVAGRIGERPLVLRS